LHSGTRERPNLPSPCPGGQPGSRLPSAVRLRPDCPGKVQCLHHPLGGPMRTTFAFLAVIAPLLLCASTAHTQSNERLRVIIETDAGGDPDDEQSMVRFLLYANEWDVEGIICSRPKARDKENINPERTSLGIVRRLLTAYGECRSNLAQHDRRYPTLKHLWDRTVPGY